MLLEKGIIQKSADGKYIAELVEQKYLNFVAYNLRSKTDIETINELINRGLNEATAVKLVGYYHTWKEKQKKKSKVWYFIAPILILLGLYIEFWLDSIFGITLFTIAAVGIGYSSASITNFKKLTFYRILNK